LTQLASEMILRSSEGSRLHGLLQLSVLAFRLLQDDDIRIGTFPQRAELCQSSAYILPRQHGIADSSLPYGSQAV
jgi:hypothetical protein